jgi:hypothetical protein
MPNRLTFAAVLVGTLLGLFETAEAQIRYRPPAGPVLPNQLNYFRRDVGLTDPYNAFVQPQRTLEAQLQQMNLQQQADYQAAQRDLQKLQDVRQSMAAPTGVGGGFLNYSHYYRMPRGGAAQPRVR